MLSYYYGEGGATPLQGERGEWVAADLGEWSDGSLGSRGAEWQFQVSISVQEDRLPLIKFIKVSIKNKIMHMPPMDYSYQ